MSSSTDLARAEPDTAADDRPRVVEGHDHLRPGFVAAALLGAVVVGLAIIVSSRALRVPLEKTDLWVFREGGRLVRDGLPLYDVKFEPGFWTYPPFGGDVMVPLTLLPVDRLMIAYWLVNLVALAALMRLSFTTVLQRIPGRATRWSAVLGLTLAGLLLYPVTNTIGMGQLGVLLTLACVVDVVLVGRGHGRWQGVLVGLLTAVKLTPAVFISVWWLARRRRAAVVAAATVAACWTFSALLRPVDTRDWIVRGILFNTDRQIGGHGHGADNQSLHGLVDGLPSGLVTPAWLLLGLPVLVLGLLWGSRAVRGGQLLEAAAITGLTSLLLSPISWQHHGVWVVPAIGALVGRPGSRLRNVLLAVVVATLALCVFVAAYDLQVMTYLVLLGMLVLQVRDSSRSEVVVNGLDSSPERYQREAYHDVMYTGAVGTFSGLVHRIMERPFRGRSSGAVLELGAGAGQHAAYVETFDSYLETDIAPRPPRGPEPRAGIERRIVDAQDLSAFPDATFDRVIATCLLAHLDQPEKALQEWRRVTRPGGTVTIYVPCEPGMLLRLARATIMVPKARRFDQDHVATVYREHRNHYPAMRMLIDSTYSDDDVRRSRWPVPFVGWNFRLFDVVHATRSEQA